MMNQTTATAAKVETVSMKANNGRHLRKVSRVTMDGRTVTFMERLSNRRAIQQATEYFAKN